MNTTTPVRTKWDGWFSLETPSGWQIDESGTAISIFDPNGVGAFTVSVLSAQNANVEHAARELAQRFAQQRDWEVSPSALRMSQSKKGSQCFLDYVQHTDRGSDFWAVAAYATEKKAVLISYTCKAADEPTERTTKESIFQSFRWETD